jgi:ubiquinone/menaquinone biosynthesis C-methylase UbiE
MEITMPKILNRSLIFCGLLLLAMLWLRGTPPPQVHEYDWDAVDEQALNERQPPDAVMDALGVAPGMKVAEVGAGGGRYVVKMAARVGPAGTVYANDIAPGAIEYLARRIRREGLTNVELILGTETDPKLPAGRLDLVYLTFTYRHLSEPFEVLKNILPALNGTGILAIMESKPPPGSSGDRDMIDTAERAGYHLVRIETFLSQDNIWVFKPKAE